MSDEIWKAYTHGIAAAINEGGMYIPSLLFRSYSSLGISESEAMLLLQIMQYTHVERNDFPTLEELAQRMGTNVRNIGTMLGRLMKDGFLTIDDYVDSESGMQAERYNWSGWLMQAAEWSAAVKREAKKAERQPVVRESKPASDMFSVFEQEFGRLLSPMECETISSWIDQDRYTDEIILFALKEAVFAGKVSLKYIDRILLEWSRNRVTNTEEARAHSQKFYGGKA
ncbi:DnaD domain protein [Paenibacillus sp. GSMTC-2017]|uniref:DnaD domain protein n=1 Tax=Paenibacillus sp. GSMTC-2017 TaxID=2794350 RepID=UPI0018D74A50|nr:DnaD domain protein [Paenibacillus sp. GSMTC-2017]MBH5317910.1 DnaD domain protein [Paenibacillus sp. GSMTC-2017]